jgi:hypothetical protein
VGECVETTNEIEVRRANGRAVGELVSLVVLALRTRDKRRKTRRKKGLVSVLCICEVGLWSYFSSWSSQGKQRMDG